MKRLIGIAVFSAMAGAAFAGETFELNGIAGKNISQAAGDISVKVPEAANADIVKDITKTPNLWKQASLKAADGTVITVDYTPMSAGKEIIMAEPVWVSVMSPGHQMRKVRVVLINYFEDSDQTKEIQTLDLTPVQSYTFKARAQSIALREMVYAFRQEIAVVVDGNWLVDPVTGGHNFKFNMAR